MRVKFSSTQLYFLLTVSGGLNTKFAALKANLVLSVAVAFTGISVPIALSYVLQSLSGATPLQAFAAGAALCSTSLGTTFTILSSCGLSETRLGVVLSSAAMMDDVVGLIMVQVISNLGQSSSSFDAVTVVRPIGVSVALVIAVPLVCRYIAKPVTIWLNDHRQGTPEGLINKVYEDTFMVLMLHTAVLLGLVTAAGYAGTSNLFAAYLAGASVSWWDSEVLHYSAIKSIVFSLNAEGPTRSTESRSSAMEQSDIIVSPPETSNARESVQSRDLLEVQQDENRSGNAIYEKYYAAALQRILKPFFFVSPV